MIDVDVAEATQRMVHKSPHETAERMAPFTKGEQRN